VARVWSDTAILDLDSSHNEDRPARATRAITLLTAYILLLTFIPSPLVLGALGGAGSPATLFAFTLLSWYVLLWLHPGFALYRGRQPARLAAAFFAFVFVAAYVSANRHTLDSTAQNGADRGMIFVTGWLAVMLLAADGIETWDQLQVLLRRLVTCISVIAAIGITQFATGFNLATYVVIPGLTRQIAFVDLLTRDGINRPSATTAHPLEFAAVLGLALPLALHQARFARPGTRFRRWLQVALIATALPLTVSRSVVLGLVIIACVLMPTWPARQLRIAYPALAGGLIALWVVEPRLISLIYQLFSQTGSESSSVSRLDAYSAAGPFIAQHPWLGQGFGTFLPQTYFFVDDQYLTTLIETGVLGLTAVLLLFLLGWCLARSTRRICVDQQTRDLLQCLAVSVLCTALSFSTFDALGYSTISGLTFLLIGCTAAAWRLARTGALIEPCWWTTDDWRR
jgi:polysaccharide biosynthesis protein PslJ